MAAPLYPESQAQVYPISYQPFNNPSLNDRSPRAGAAHIRVPPIVAHPANPEQVRAHSRYASVAWNIFKNAFTCTGFAVIITASVCLLSLASGHVAIGMSLTVAMPLMTLGAFSISVTLFTIYTLYRAIMHRPIVIPLRPLTELECIELELRQICRSCSIAVEHGRLDLAYHQLKTLQAIMQPQFHANTPPSIPMLVECLPTLHQLLHLPLRQNVQEAYPQEYKEHFAHECHALIHWVETLQQAGR